MTNQEEIAVLNAEAWCRGTSYGKLMAATTQMERWAIIQLAKRAVAARARRKEKRQPPHEGRLYTLRGCAAAFPLGKPPQRSGVVRLGPRVRRSP